MVRTENRNATTSSLKRYLNSIGITAPYQTLFRTLNVLQKKVFVADADQYKLLKDYARVLNEAQHKAVLEIDDDGVFQRIGIIFREGIQSFDAFFQRGLQVDGTFLKNKAGVSSYEHFIKQTT